MFWSFQSLKGIKFKYENCWAKICLEKTSNPWGFYISNDHQFKAKRIHKLCNLTSISRDNNSLEFYLKLAFLEKCKLVKTNESSGRVFFISNSFAQKRTLVMWFCWLHQNQIKTLEAISNEIDALYFHFYVPF